MVDLFDWEEQGVKAEIDLSGSGIGPFDDLDKLKMSDKEPEEILAEWYGVKPENVLVVHGSQEGTFLAYMGLKPQSVYIPLPSYPPIFEQAEALDINVNFTGLKPEVEDSVIVLANPNNPTGYYIKDLDKLADNNLVIVDEIFKPFVDEDILIHPNIIIISSTSKFFGFKDRKVGWIIGDKEYIHKIRLARDLATPTPLYDSILVKYAFKNYDFFKERSLGIVRRNIDVLRKNVKGFEIRYNPDMPIAVISRDNLDSMEFCKKFFEKKNVLFTPTDYFGMKGGVRIRIGFEDIGLLEEALRRLNEFTEEFF